MKGPARNGRPFFLARALFAIVERGGSLAGRAAAAWSRLAPTSPARQNDPSAACLTMAASVGGGRYAREPTGHRSGWPIADSVLGTAADRDRCEVVLVLIACRAAPGRGDPTSPLRPSELRARDRRVMRMSKAPGGPTGSCGECLGRWCSAPGAMRSRPPQREAGKRAQRFRAASSVSVIRGDAERPPAHRCAWQMSSWCIRTRRGTERSERMSCDRFPGARSGAR